MMGISDAANGGPNTWSTMIGMCTLIACWNSSEVDISCSNFILTTLYEMTQLVVIDKVDEQRKLALSIVH